VRLTSAGIEGGVRPEAGAASNRFRRWAQRGSSRRSKASTGARRAPSSAREDVLSYAIGGTSHSAPRSRGATLGGCLVVPQACAELGPRRCSVVRHRRNFPFRASISWRHPRWVSCRPHRVLSSPDSKPAIPSTKPGGRVGRHAAVFDCISRASSPPAQQDLAPCPARSRCPSSGPSLPLPDPGAPRSHAASFASTPAAPPTKPRLARPPLSVPRSEPDRRPATTLGALVPPPRPFRAPVVPTNGRRPHPPSTQTARPTNAGHAVEAAAQRPHEAEPRS
jgi:hypothetical protein